MTPAEQAADSYGSWQLAIAKLRAELESLMAKGLTREQAQEEMRRRRQRTRAA